MGALLATLFAPAAVVADETAPPVSTPRPPPTVRRTPPPAAPCELWTGAVRGNDPDVAVAVTLCTDGDRVTGMLRWTSIRSGTNVRELAGEWAAGHAHLTLHDARFVAQNPTPTWRFCLVTHYDLDAAGDGHLEGSYDAPDCTDHARVSLTRQSGR